jgi:predicted transcriptional regulator of viral defense system
MSTASDLHRWLLGNHIAVVNLHSREWRLAQEAVGLRAGVTQEKCLARMVETGSLRHVRRGLYVVVDPAREAPPVAVASGAFAHTDHYVTTDAALAVHRLIDQPIPVMTVIVPHTRPMSFRLGTTLVRASEMPRARFDAADHYAMTLDGLAVRLASRVLAVADALEDPRRMTHLSLLPEILPALDEGEIERLAVAALARSRAAAQRLGYLLDDAGVVIPAALASLAPTSVAYLRPGRRTGSFSTRWRVHG